jgi:hypothetical protein
MYKTLAPGQSRQMRKSKTKHGRRISVIGANCTSSEIIHKRFSCNKSIYNQYSCLVSLFQGTMMSKINLLDCSVQPAGYYRLIKRLNLHVIPNWHESLVAPGNTKQIESTGGIIRETYAAKYWPGEGLGDHLEFALKYDGVNLAILASIFKISGQAEITACIESKPTGKYARRIWYLYEMITGERLPLDDLQQGNYVDLLNPDDYYTPIAVRRILRQRVNDNLMGDSRFCPIVRRSEKLRKLASSDLKRRCLEVVADKPPELLKRALNYLYTKETKSSFEIEHIKQDANRTERFVSLLQLAESEDFFDKPHLIDLQNRIVDSRFAANDYRQTQNYVGQTVSINQERIHYVGPKPEDLKQLMEGLLAIHPRICSLKETTQPIVISSIVHAAIVAYGFVFMHPFEDGNGRIHRFLIHNILALGGFWRDEGVMLPISATMLKNPAEYDASLEAFSKPLMSLVEYELDEDGRMVVLNNTGIWYRFIDMTAQVEILFSLIEKTISTELVEELNFLVNYDHTKAALQDIVDMPDSKIDLFIRFCLQNHGQLSARKRISHFDFLTDDEIDEMQQAVQAAYGNSIIDHAE